MQIKFTFLITSFSFIPSPVQSTVLVFKGHGLESCSILHLFDALVTCITGITSHDSKSFSGLRRVADLKKKNAKRKVSTLNGHLELSFLLFTPKDFLTIYPVNNKSVECWQKRQNLNKCPDVLRLCLSSVECSLWVAPRFLVLNLNFESCVLHAHANFK